jgi:hypothetical protein
MKNSFKLFLAAAAFVGFASNASAQAGNTDNASATAYARIISPINIENVEGSNLEFGSMVASAGTVTVSPAGARTAAGTIVVNQGTTPDAADFHVTGEDTYTYAITLPTTSSITNGTDNITVSNFTSSIGATGTLTGGSSNFSVGGKITLTGSESTGLYSGTFQVTAAYN